MAALSIQLPFPVFTDSDGQPVEGGYVWIGRANLDPRLNPVNVYFDKDLTIPAGQPLRTVGGYITYNGSPAQLFIDGTDYSILVQNQKGIDVYSFPSGTGIAPDASSVTYTPASGPATTVQARLREYESSGGSALIGYQPVGTGAVARTVQDKLREVLSVKDFGAVGDGVTDDTSAISAALDVAIAQKLQVHFPAGRYIITSPISKTLSGDGSFKLFGDGENISIIELNTGGNGLSFTLPGNWYLDNAGGSNGAHFSNLTFTTTNASVGQGLTLTGASVAGRPGAKVTLENVEFRPKSNFGQYWGRAVSIYDCQDVWVNHCRFIAGGPTNNTANGLFISGTAVGNSPTTVFVNHCEFLYGNIQLQVKNYVEGVYVTNCAMVGGIVGIRMDPVVGESGLHVMGGHISSTLYNIDTDNVFDFEVVGGLYYRSGTTANFNNIRIRNAGRFCISGNVFKGTNVDDGEVAVNVVSTIDNEQQGGYIGGNTFHLYATRAIWLNSSANFVHVGENSFRGCAVRLLNQSANANNSITPHAYTVSIARTLTGGALTENIDLPLPTGLFRIKPGAGIVNVDAGSVLQVRAAYDFDASSETNARIVVRNPSGGNIPAGTYRFHVALFEQAYAAAF